jgi:hypothetical protein
MASNHIIRAGAQEYASAAWEEGDTIPEISLDNSGVPGKYTATVTNILSKHLAEVKISSDEIIQPIASISKKKLKELITKHNNEIFSFMARPDRTPHTLGLAETLFRRYGHEIPTIKGNNPNSILKDLNLDVSTCEVSSFFDEGLKKTISSSSANDDSKEVGGINDFMQQMRWIYNQYKTVGEEVLRLETVLYEKMDLLDKLNSRMSLIVGLKTNDALPDLINSFTKYADTVFSTSKIEDTYKEFVEAYKKWNVCRQIISMNNNFKTDTNEPQCSICLSESISHAIVPCGHTFCGSCVKKQNTTCYICRGTIRERIKLFFT